MNYDHCKTTTLDATGVIITFLSLWDGATLATTPTELIVRFLDWPLLPIDIREDTIRWFEMAIQENRELMNTDKEPIHTQIYEHTISSLERLRTLYRERAHVPFTTAELYEKYSWLSRELNQEKVELENLDDYWPEILQVKI